MRFLAAATTAALLLLVLFQYDGEKTASIITTIDSGSIFTVATLMLVAFAFSGLRTFVVMKDAGLRVHWSGAAHASLVGAVGNILMNMIGYVTARSLYLRSLGIKTEDSIVLCFYEKIAALAVLFVMSITGAIYLFGSISVDLGGAAFLPLKMGATALACIFLGLGFAYGRQASTCLTRFMRSAGATSLLRVIVLTVLIHGAMLASYVSVGLVMAPDTNPISLAAAAAIVMFAASLPISFSGWGVRELSAVHAFGFVGVTAAEALAIAVVIGALSMAVMFLLTGLSTLAAPACQGKHDRKPEREIAAGWRFRGDTILAVSVPLMSASLVFFTVRLPTHSGGINVNLADPLALVGGVLALILWYRHSGVGARWRVAGVETVIGTMTAVMLYGLALGWVRFGWFDWAFINRGVGWGAILAYFLTGSLVAYAGGERFLRLFANAFVAAAAAVVLADYGLRLANAAGVPFHADAFSPRMEGLAQNPNALAFQLLIAYAVSLVAAPVEALTTRRIRVALEGIILAGIWLSASRSGLITLAVMIVGLLGVGAVSWRRLGPSAAIAAGVVVLLWTPDLLSMTGATGSSTLGSMAHQATQANDAERLHSMVGGLSMWREYWLFGAGLGAFMYGELQASGSPLVIHSTPIWLLAEMGLIGFLAVVLPVALVIRNLLARLRVKSDPAILAALCCLVIIGVEMQPHEMLYQRTFWLIMGALLAMPHAVLFWRDPGGATLVRTRQLTENGWLEPSYPAKMPSTMASNSSHGQLRKL